MPLIFLFFHLQLILYKCNIILLPNIAYFFILKCSFEWNFTFLLLLSKTTPPSLWDMGMLWIFVCIIHYKVFH